MNLKTKCITQLLLYTNSLKTFYIRSLITFDLYSISLLFSRTGKTQRTNTAIMIIIFVQLYNVSGVLYILLRNNLINLK